LIFRARRSLSIQTGFFGTFRKTLFHFFSKFFPKTDHAPPFAGIKMQTPNENAAANRKRPQGRPFAAAALAAGHHPEMTPFET
jgi:hypothetical protein